MKNTPPQIQALRHHNGKWERIALPAMPYGEAIGLAERGDLNGEPLCLHLSPAYTDQLDTAAIYLYDGLTGGMAWQDAIRPGVTYDSSDSELERQRFGAFLARDRVDAVREAMEKDWFFYEIENLLPDLEHVETFAPRAERLAAKNATPVRVTIWDEAVGYDSWDTAVALLKKIEIAIAWQHEDQNGNQDYSLTFEELCAKQEVKLHDFAREVYATLEDRPMVDGDRKASVTGLRYGPWRRVDGRPLQR